MSSGAADGWVEAASTVSPAAWAAATASRRVCDQRGADLGEGGADAGRRLQLGLADLGLHVRAGLPEDGGVGHRRARHQRPGHRVDEVELLLDAEGGCGHAGAPGVQGAAPNGTGDSWHVDLSLGDDLRAFVDASPSPGHAAAEIARRLVAGGFRELAETALWELSPGDAVFAVRGASVVAVRVGSEPVPEAGLRIIGAHTDSPTFRVRPRSDVRQAGYRLVGVEPYGGGLWHTWLDRELTVAGRLALRGGTTALVRLPGAPLRLPSLAIHLDRSVREGLTLDPQRHLQPVWGSELSTEPGLLEALGAAAGVSAADVVGHDLVLADTQPAARAGADGTWIAAPRLDDLACCHSGLLALLGARGERHTQVLVCNDHEEVGSGSASGARGSFLEDVIGRLAGDRQPQASARTIAASKLVSADMAHAVHPTRSERHDPSHQPVLGGGPVLKLNANQAYATDAVSGGWFTERCEEAGVPVQHFVSRADLPCGSTIGPLTATRLGLSTVDVGAPQLAMHSVRELASAADVPLMVGAFTSCLQSARSGACSSGAPARKRAVVLPDAATCSGVPAATTRPPASPPPGPRSSTQSAWATTSMSCSTSTTVLPASTSDCSCRISTSTSAGCRPLVGSSSR